MSVFLKSDCLEGGEEDDAQVLTLTVETVDEDQPRSLAGFTLSFKQYPILELLRLSLSPEEDARSFPESETWRDPPAHLRLPSGVTDEVPATDNGQLLSLEDQLKELQSLEFAADALVKTIEEKKKFINSKFPDFTKGLKQEIKDCDSFSCVVRAIGDRVHNAARAAYVNFHKSHHAYTMWQSNTAGGQAPTMLSNAGVITTPEDAHCHDSSPVARPPHYKVPVTTPNEKTSAYNTSQPHKDEPQWRDAADPSIFIVILKFFAAITGLTFLFKLLRMCCMSDRKRVERAAERERRATEKLYKCAARKQSWRDWWNGRKRGKPGYRAGDYEEKRGLILQQESILEGAMQDEIQQLAIREEIRQLRSTRDAVDDLVRAEEGRNVLPRYSATGSSSHPLGFQRIPAPITIPSATSRVYPMHEHDYDHDDHPGTPLSRTSSLPDYKTEASSEPPGYESDRRSSFSDHDAYSEYAHSLHNGESVWSPGSSIPDLSPRPSMETAHTIETARTFL